MSNTYFRVKSIELKKTESEVLELTAFVGGSKTIQITMLGGKQNTTVIQLTNEQIVRLAGALLERFSGIVTATGYEKSAFMLKKDEE